MWNNRNDEEVSTEIEEGRAYTKTELNLIGDAILREQTKTELCRTCGEQGEETGHVEYKEQVDKDEKPMVDEEGNQLVLSFKEYECPKGHSWYEGEGRARGIGGENPILFEEHLHSRRRREIYTTVGVPDPSIVSGIYNRTHPEGRKVNSKEQRKKNGASFFR